MNKTLKPDELDKIPKDGIDYRDFILQVASNNNWVFDLSEYSNAIVNAKKGALGRVGTTLKELEDDRYVIKRSGSRIYEVTTKGIKSLNSITEPDQSKISEHDYNTVKLNRTSDSIDAVETKVSRTSTWIAFASVVSAIAIITQVFLSIFGTTTIDGKINISPQQEEIEQLKKELKHTTEAKDRLSYELDSLKMERQKLSKK